jgi:glycerol-3-phosphate dehydrogenase (NAD(P)+)
MLSMRSNKRKTLPLLCRETMVVTVLGAGSWGTALAVLLACHGYKVRLWARDPHLLRDLGLYRENRRYLPGVVFPERRDFTLEMASQLPEAVLDSHMLVLAIPSGACMELVQRLQISGALRHRPLLVNTAKGLDPHSGLWFHQAFGALLGNDYPFAFLSGPSFARSVALGQPTAVVLAALDAEVAQTSASFFHGGSFRVYCQVDCLGVALGGTLKNIFAFATGAVEGLNLGSNAGAALLTRGLHEMLRLGRALGAAPETLTGLSGLGDLILTATDNQSRNRRFGVAVGQGLSKEQAISAIGQVIECVGNTALMYRLAVSVGVEMPILEQVYAILYQERPVLEAVSELLNRPSKSET